MLLSLTLLVRAHSRRRELAADDRAVEVTGDPAAPARALRRIRRATDPGGGLFATLYVSGEGDEHPLTRLLSTHPDVNERIDRLADRGRRQRRRIEVR